MWGFADLCFIPNQDWGEGGSPTGRQAMPSQRSIEEKAQKMSKVPKTHQSLKTLKTTTEGSALDEGGGNVFV